MQLMDISAYPSCTHNAVRSLLQPVCIALIYLAANPQTRIAVEPVADDTAGPNGHRHTCSK